MKRNRHLRNITDVKQDRGVTSSYDATTGIIGPTVKNSYSHTKNHQSQANILGPQNYGFSEHSPAPSQVGKNIYTTEMSPPNILGA